MASLPDKFAYLVLANQVGLRHPDTCAAMCSLFEEQEFPMAQSWVPSVGFLTTCKGRLHHLKQTMPRIVAEQPDEIIVVDHDCPQNTGDWLEENYPSVIVARVRDGAPFKVARARNIGIRLSKSDILCVIDADILVQPGFVAWIRENAHPHVFFRHALEQGRRDAQTWGTVICPRLKLLKIGLYDEAFDGWGGEDDDLYYRLKITGTAEEHFPFEYARAISHDENERFAQYAEKTRGTHLLLNRLYREAKRTLLGFTRAEDDLPLELRQKLRKEVRRAVNSLKNGQASMTIKLPDKRPVLQQVNLERQLTLELKVTIEEADPQRKQAG